MESNGRIMESNGRENKHHFVLVHGACHGAWSWYKLWALLESAGHRVTTPDLAASGIDGRRIEEVATLADYSQPLMEIMASVPAQEKVILVGHSLGGANIALAADRFPEKVASLVFVTVFMPDCNSNAPYVLDMYLEQSSNSSSKWLDTKFSLVGGTTQPPHTSMLFGPQFIASKLYQLYPPEDIKLATTLVRPGSLFVEDLRIIPAFSKDRYGSVPCFYVECCEDAAIPKEFQQCMTQNHQVNKVLKIEGADHMAMLSKPQELYQCLLDIVNSI